MDPAVARALEALSAPPSLASVFFGGQTGSSSSTAAGQNEQNSASAAAHAAAVSYVTAVQAFENAATGAAQVEQRLLQAINSRQPTPLRTFLLQALLAKDDGASTEPAAAEAMAKAPQEPQKLDKKNPDATVIVEDEDVKKIQHR